MDIDFQQTMNGLLQQEKGMRQKPTNMQLEII